MVCGFSYFDDFLSVSEERRLLRRLEREPFECLRMRGQRTKRALVSYGLRFKPHVGELGPAPPLPRYLHSVRVRAAALIDMSGDVLEQSLLTRYPQGSDIGWHTDHASFGDVVVAISLHGDATLAFRREREMHRVLIRRRSLYVLRDAARYEYEHRVTARALRYSITLRPIAIIGASSQHGQ